MVGLLTTLKGKTSEIYRKLLLVRQLEESAGEHAVTVKSRAGVPLRFPLALQPRHFSEPWLQYFAYTIDVRK